MKYSAIVLVVVLVGSILPSCKKGEEDPALSFKSRKARLSGEWMEKDFSTNTPHIDTLLYIQDNYAIGTSTYQINNIIINKDGTWESTSEYDYQLDRLTVDALYLTKSKIASKSSGTWSFLGKIKGDYKNKERIILSYEKGESTSLLEYSEKTPLDPNEPKVITYPNSTYYSSSNFQNYGESNKIYDIIMLKSKEMKWRLDRSSTESNMTKDSLGFEIDSNFYSDYFQNEIHYVAK